MGGVSAIVTAAGESTRMGSPKALLRWRGVTLIEYQLRALFDAGAGEVVAVLGHDPEPLTGHVERAGGRFVVNDEYRLGKTTSIKAGLRAIDAGADAVLLLAVDQPRTPEIIAQVIRTHIEHDALITSPRYQGRGGHPLIFSSALKGELEAITEEKQGIREVFQAHRRQVVETLVDDPMVRLDLNTPLDYELARQRYGA